MLTRRVMVGDFQLGPLGRTRAFVTAAVAVGLVSFKGTQTLARWDERNEFLAIGGSAKVPEGILSHCR